MEGHSKGFVLGVLGATFLMCSIGYYAKTQYDESKKKKKVQKWDSEKYRIERRINKIEYKDLKHITIFGHSDEVQGIVNYLAQFPNFRILIASPDQDEVNQMIIKNGFQLKCESRFSNFKNFELLCEIAGNSDLVISLLKNENFESLIEACIDTKTNLITPMNIHPDQRIIQNSLKFISECNFLPTFEYLNLQQLKHEIEFQRGVITRYECWSGVINSDISGHAYNPFSYECTWDSKNPFKEFKVDVTFDIHPESDMDEEVKNDTILTVHGSKIDDYESMAKMGLQDCEHFVRGELRYKGYATVIQSLIEIGMASTRFRINHRETKYVRELTQKLASLSETEPSDNDHLLDKFMIDRPQDRELICKLLSMTSFTYLGDLETILDGWLYYGLLNSKLEIPHSAKTPNQLLTHIAKQKIKEYRGTDYLIINQCLEVRKLDGDVEEFKYALIKTKHHEIVDTNPISLKNEILGHSIGILSQTLLNKHLESGVYEPYHSEIYPHILPKFEQFGYKMVRKP